MKESNNFLIHLLAIILMSSAALLNLRLGDSFIYFPELIFILVTIISFILIKKIKIYWNTLDSFVLLYFTYCILHSYMMRCIDNDNDVFIQIYLLAYYFTIRWMTDSGGLNTRYVLVPTFKLIVCIGFILGFIGMIRSYTTGVDSAFAWYYKDYPYFGDMPRARAYFGTPEMMAIFHSMALIIFYTEKKEKNTWLFILIAALGLLMTLSKTIVACVAILIWYCNANFVTKKIKGITSITLILIYFLSIHFLLVSNDTGMNQSVLGRIIYNNENTKIHLSAYAELKLAALRISAKKIIAGVGANCFNTQLPMMNTPISNMGDYDPHCTWLGMLAERGFLGLLILIVLVGYIFYIMHHHNVFSVTSLAWMSFLFIVSWNTDILNFRQWWWLVLLIGFEQFKLRDFYTRSSE